MKKNPVEQTDHPDASRAAPENENGDGDDNELRADLDRFRDLAMRTQADFENYKKRHAREKEDAIKYANTSLLEKLIKIVDNFELGLSAAQAESENSANECR